MNRNGRRHRLALLVIEKNPKKQQLVGIKGLTINEALNSSGGY